MMRTSTDRVYRPRHNSVFASTLAVLMSIIGRLLSYISYISLYILSTPSNYECSTDFRERTIVESVYFQKAMCWRAAEQLTAMNLTICQVVFCNLLLMQNDFIHYYFLRFGGISTPMAFFS